jgi:hypothetical protein
MVKDKATGGVVMQWGYRRAWKPEWARIAYFVKNTGWVSVKARLVELATSTCCTMAPWSAAAH